jgi:gluconolactonase
MSASRARAIPQTECRALSDRSAARAYAGETGNPAGRRPLLSAAAALLLLLTALAARGATLTVVDPQAHYPEGPLWRDGRLLYVEYSANNIKSWDGKSSHVLWHRDGCGASGLIPFRDHLLVACYDDNSLVELDASAAEVRVIRSDSHGRAFAGPNDFASDGHGGLYFSASGAYDLKAPITGAVLHVSADGGSIEEVAATIHYANGLTLMHDRQHLLVAEMLAGRILSFPIQPDGHLGPRTVWARLQDIAPPTTGADAYNGPDGLKLGPDGCYYIAQNGSGRILVVSEDKRLVRLIKLATPYVTNMAFGAEGSRALFITGAFEQWKAPYPGIVYRWTP